jgi:hypothetical protein
MRSDAALCGIRYSAAEKAEAIRLYEAGVPLPEIRARIGMSKAALQKWIRTAGLRPRRSGFPCARPEVTGERARQLWHEYGSARAAAEAIGMSPSTFTKRAYGIHLVSESARTP